MTTRAQKNAYCRAFTARRRARKVCTDCKQPSPVHWRCDECRAYWRGRAKMLAEVTT